MSNPIFRAEEFEGRYERARRRMAEAGLSAVVAYGPGNQFWLSGYLGPSVTQYLAPFFDQMLLPKIVLPLEREPTLLGMKSAGDVYAYETHIKDIRSLTAPPGERPRIIRDILHGHGIRSGKVGIDLSAPGGIGSGELARLERELSPIELVDVAPMFSDLRSVKTPAEIACLRRAVEIQNEAFRLFVTRASRRMSGAEIRTEMMRAQLEAGATDIGVVLTSGHPAAGLFGAPSDRPDGEGGLRWIDGGSAYKGYTSDYDIVVAWGEPDAEQIRTHGALRDAYTEAMEAWRPGRAVTEIVADTRAVVARHGLTDLLDGNFMGHCLGCEVVERPWFGVRSPKDLLLRPGMVIAPEWVTRTDLGDFLWEENFLVTETGLEKLSDFPAELQVIAD